MTALRDDDPSAPILERLTVRFIDRDLEADYRTAQRARNLRQTRLALAISMTLNTIFVVIDPITFDVNQGTIMLLRLFVANGWLLLMMGLSLLPYFHKRWPMLLFFGAVGYTGFAAFINVLGEGEGAYAGGFVTVVLAIYVLLPFYFLHGLVTAWLCTAIYCSVAPFAIELSAGDLGFVTLMLISANAIGMFALYRTEQFRRLDFVNTRAISEERGRFQQLLNRILPVSVAARLHGGEERIADLYEDSTVLFADVVGFTGVAAEHPPHQVLDFLDGLFSRFDSLVEARGLEKIKTIGDEYMVAGGLPEEKPDHAEAMADLALEMLKAVEDMHTPAGRPVHLRIGLHSGPLVAGVVGGSRFLYDLWGDTVNTASRMEATGTPGRIQVSDALHTRLGDRFRFEPRGEIEVKGKGRMPVWYLTGRIPTSGSAPASLAQGRPKSAGTSAPASTAGPTGSTV